MIRRTLLDGKRLGISVLQELDALIDVEELNGQNLRID